MIYGFAKQSGGQVRIKSEEGRGARVYLQLPTHDAEIDAVTRSEPLPESAMVSSGETVLVVDDEHSVRIFVSEALGSCGYIVIEATDSLTGLQLLRSDTRIDLLVTDIGLPGGIIAVLTKPFTLEALALNVNNLLRKYSHDCLR